MEEKERVMLRLFIDNIFLPEKKKKDLSRKIPPFFPIRGPGAEGDSVALRWKVRRVAKK